MPTPVSDDETQHLEAAESKPFGEGEVFHLELDGREIVLVGTAHVSRSSVDVVKHVIAQEQPDHVCVELDAQRYQALSQRQRWEQLDLKEIIRRKQLTMLLVSLLLSAYQRRLGAKLGIEPGAELLEAVKLADEAGIPRSLSDRDVRITLTRAARTMPFFKKLLLFSNLVASAFVTEEFTEEEIQKLKQQDVLSEVMEELAKFQPSIKRVVIDERDAYLAAKIREAPGQKVVAIVGAGHVRGIEEALVEGREVDFEALEHVPPASPVWKILGWGIPALILGALAWIGYSQGSEVAGESAVYWVLANAIPASLGALIALGHPVTVAVAFVSAPFTSLTPVIGAGYVTAFVQTWMRPPVVKEFQTVMDDVSKARKWWSNKLLRIFLTFLLPSLGSILGTALGGAEIFSKLF